MTSSSTVARAGAARRASRPVAPVSIVPPSERRCAASASVMRCEPPRATGQPTAWAGAPSTRPNAGADRRPQRTASSARAARRAAPGRARPRSASAPARPPSAAPRAPKRASSSGWRGRRSGPSSSATSASAVGDERPEQPPVGALVRRRARGRLARPSARACTAGRRRAGARAGPRGGRARGRARRSGRSAGTARRAPAGGRPSRRRARSRAASARPCAAAADGRLGLEHEHASGRPGRARSPRRARSGPTPTTTASAPPQATAPSFAARPRAFMCASASIVTIGLTPDAVGKAAPSTRTGPPCSHSRRRDRRPSRSASRPCGRCP